MTYLKSAPPAMASRIELLRASVRKIKSRAESDVKEYERDFLFLEEANISILIALASRPEMDSAWKTLAKVFDDTKNPTDTHAFANACIQIVNTWNLSPKRTAKEHTDHFRAISRDLMDVTRRIMVEPEFGKIGPFAARLSPIAMLSDEDIESLVDVICADPSGEDVTAKKPVSDVRGSLSQRVPQLYEFARWIADRAEEIAAQQSIAPRPRRDSAARIFFVKSLSSWFDKKFERRLHEVVASVASTIFNELVTADTVRKLAQSEPEVLPMYLRVKPPLPG